MSLSSRFCFFRRLIAISALGVLVTLCTACSDDDFNHPSINGTWSDAFGGTLTISPTHFSIIGDGFFGPWNYAGTIEAVDHAARFFVIRYTNAGTLAAGQDILNRYNKIIWKNLVVTGSEASMEYQELYNANLTNSAGDFIAWPTREEARLAVTDSSWFTQATNTSYPR